MPPDTGPSLDTRQPAESQFLGTSRKVAVPPLHPLFSLRMQFCITCASPPPGVLKQSLSIRLPAESQVMPTGCRFKVQGGPLTDRPWGGGGPQRWPPGHGSSFFLSSPTSRAPLAQGLTSAKSQNAADHAPWASLQNPNVIHPIEPGLLICSLEGKFSVICFSFLISSGYCAVLLPVGVSAQSGFQSPKM